MTDFNTGDYAANQAGILDAWTKAKAAISAQRQSTLQNYGYGANGQLDPTNKYGQYQQIEHNYALSQPDQQHNQDAYNAQYGTNVGRENEDYATQLARGQKQSGFNFKNGGLELDPNDPNGAYQQMLGGQTRQLTSLEDAQVSRGLGHGGLANRAVDQAEGDASSNRSNYRDQLLNQFMDNQKGHTRTDRGLRHTEEGGGLRISESEERRRVPAWSRAEQSRDRDGGLDERVRSAGIGS